MVFDNKKEHKEFYLPPKTPGIVNAPAMSFLAARGHGEPEKQAMWFEGRGEQNERLYPHGNPFLPVRSQLRFVQYASGWLLSRLRRRSRQPELHYG